MKLLLACSLTVLASCAALAGDIPSFASPAKIDDSALKLNAVAAEVQREFLKVAVQRILPMRSFVDVKEQLVLPPAASMERFADQPSETSFRNKAHPSAQRDAGSQRSSGDPLASETPFSLGPRG